MSETSSSGLGSFAPREPRPTWHRLTAVPLKNGTVAKKSAALSAGRSSISVEVEPSYLTLELRNIEQVTRQQRLGGARKAELIDTRPKKRRARGGA